MKFKKTKELEHTNFIEEITSLNSFVKLYRKTREIKTSKLLIKAFFIVLVLITTVNFDSNTEANAVASKIVEYSENLINWGISILGFILAGYSIYATLTDKKLNIALAMIRHPSYEMSYLMYIHLVFIKVIIEITIICVIIFFTKITLDSTSIQIFIKNYDSTTYLVYLLIFMLSIIQSLLNLILMSCLVFIYNVYHSIMTSIRWFAENPDE
ncbi:hypothetical protein CKQ84_04045 [Shewanella sp. WE21]|jgi:hypothetical protein|uniref:hypothetical protein n=1 Tax=Shewanella sp. WE21 TaxID=2029986 RepID=UPI000CF673E6|nr:hypothetical protein [Shewanella sp. WE21]AVI65118.1 hypothetical protein CKQ84_04045 [Shewanella sp. WE21]